MSDYKCTRKALRDALSRLMLNPLYYRKKLDNELKNYGISDEDYLEMLKDEICMIAQVLIDKIS